MKKNIPRPNSVILTDWAADVDNLRTDRNSFIYQLLILSLLYDEILIQDELLVLSNQLSSWFGLREDNWIWQELLDIDSLVVLRHPISLYRTNNLKSLAEDHPIEARAKYIKKYATKGDQIFYPNEIQKNFYSITEYCLRQQVNARKREVGMNSNIDIMKSFSKTFINVLTDQNYSSWLNSSFPLLQREDISLYLEYINEPNKLVKAFKKNHIPLKKIADQEKNTIVNRSLAYQIASLFENNKKNSFQQIIQAAFCKPFCLRENAVGRYGGLLKAIPPPQLQIDNSNRLHESIVEIEAHINIPIGMPEIKPGFASIINDVRNTPEGKNLRESVARLGETITFEQQRILWQAIAEELAKRIKVPNIYRVSIDKIGQDFIEGMRVGVIVHNIMDPIAEHNDFLLSIQAGLLSGGLHVFHSIIHDQIHNLWGNKDKQDLVLKLENAVDFRCTWLHNPDNLE